MATRVLVATDGSAATWGAVRFAASLAREDRATVDVLSVLEPLPFSEGLLPFELPHAEEVDRAREEDLRTRVRRQLENASDGEVPPWTVVLRRGAIAPSIAAAAREFGSDLVVIGRKSRRPGVPPFGLTTAMEVIGLAGVPVLAAGPNLGGLPQKAVAAVDFGEASTRATQMAMDLLGVPGRIRLVHVIPRFDFPAALLWGWGDSYVQQLSGEFQRLQEALVPACDVEVTTDVVEGDPGDALLELSTTDGVDLIVGGSHGYLFRERVLIGSVASKLLGRAPCSVLLAPAEEIIVRPSHKSAQTIANAVSAALAVGGSGP